MRGRILFADNVGRFLKVRVEFLESSGFEVLPAHTLEEAEQLLRDEWVHLAILDIRMVDDDDDLDISGLTLAKDKAYDKIPKIILTGFPTYEAVREALGPALDGLPPAVAFLAKKEGPKAMIQAVEQAFTQYVHINWDLIIRWSEREPLSFPHLITLIEPEVDSALLPVRVGELEDLSRRLFYNSNQININRLLVQRERKVFLVVFAYSEGGVEEQFVIACGQKQSIVHEGTLYETLVPNAIGPGGIVKRKTEETVHFAATAYSLVGGDLDEMVTFSEFYRDNSVETIGTALDQLFETTLAPWYSRGRFHEEDRTLNEFFLEWADLSDETHSQSELKRRIENICQKALSLGLAELNYSPHKLTLHLADGSPAFYPNPILYLSEARMVFDAPVLCGITYGLLNGNSVLVDRQGRTWLIDFTQASRGPLVRDFVSLETAIKFDMLVTPNVQTRYDMERRLLAVSRLDEEADAEGLEPEVQKALRAISRIRHQASAVIGRDMDAYLGGLLFSAVGRLVAYDPEVRHTRSELIPYLHSLLSAAILCHRLTPPPREDLPPQAFHSLWIDEANKKVWVEGRQVALSPQEFNLLRYLYHHQGQLCGRMMIAEQVFGAAYEPGMPVAEKSRIEEGRLNSTMSRLRKKVEPNPGHPKYILVVRGEGYRLELEGSLTKT